MVAIPDPRDPTSTDHASPGVLDAYRAGWRTLSGSLGILLAVTLIVFLVNAIPSAFTDPVIDPTEPLPTGTQLLDRDLAITWAWGALVSGPLSYGLLFTYLRATRDEDPEVGDLLEGFRRYPAALGAVLLYVAVVTVGFLAFVIPGLVALVRFSFVPFLVTDERLGPVEALRESWQRTRGPAWTILGFGVLALALLLAGLALFVVGVVPASMWVYAGFANLYAGTTQRSARDQEDAWEVKPPDNQTAPSREREGVNTGARDADDPGALPAAHRPAKGARVPGTDDRDANGEEDERARD